MLNWLKKGNRNDDSSQGRGPRPAGLQTMRSDLQKKFSKGVQYNLKIVLRGDRNTGKTCLWHRLQGHKFLEEYVPTAMIQATSIQWNYKATDDIVKVDVWDVVDKGKPKSASDSLKLSHAEDDEDDSRKLDATFLDVYKGAHAVIMLFDITKKWTFNYIEKELPKVPPHIPTLILANHRDMGSHRVIVQDEVRYLAEEIDRPPGSAGVFFLESSMKTGFGLKYIHKFFNIPFLLVQRESLLKQLETNYLDVESCLEELRYEPDNEEQNYECVAKMAQEKQRQVNSNPPAQATTPNGHPEIPNKTQRPDNKPSALAAQPVSQRSVPPSTLPVQPPNSKEAPKSDAGGGLFSPSMMTGATSPKEETPKETKRRGFMSLFSKGPSKQAAKEPEATAPAIVSPTAPSTNYPPPDIDEFVPDDVDADNFLNEIPDLSSNKRYAADPEESSDEEDGGNPMVAGFQEELDSDDQIDNNESHKVYSYSDSDDDYITSPKTTHGRSQPVSSRSVPKSRVSPEPRREDTKLQSLVIESEESDTDQNTFEIIPDRDSLSENEEFSTPASRDVYVDTLTSPVDVTPLPRPDLGGGGEDGSANSSPTLVSRKSQSTRKNDLETSLRKHKRVSETVDSSSEEESPNQMVSTAVEDFSSNEEEDSSKFEKPASVGSEEKEDIEEDKSKNRLSLQLQSSDFDFLEKISTSSSPKLADTSHKSSKSSSTHKSKSHRKKHSEETEETTHKKHKHKKKKSSKTKEDASHTDSKKSKKKSSSRSKTKEDNDLEAFLGEGGGYDAF